VSLLALITVSPLEVISMSPFWEVMFDPVIVVSPLLLEIGLLIPELIVRLLLLVMFDATAVDVLMLVLVLVPLMLKRRSAYIPVHKLSADAADFVAAAASLASAKTKLR